MLQFHVDKCFFEKNDQKDFNLKNVHFATKNALNLFEFINNFLFLFLN